MTLNPYFSNYSTTTEQSLHANLVIESIQIKGVDCVYIPRQAGAEDYLYGEDPLSYFDDIYTLEMYVKSVDGFNQGGNGDFLSKFGLQIRDEIILTVSSSRFTTVVTGKTRPLEGDLIYFPLSDNLLEITFVEEEEQFYTHGVNNIYTLTCQLYEYSSERMLTGNTEIDSIQTDKAYSILLTFDSGTGEYTIDETVYQGANLESATLTATASTWDSNNSILEITDIVGTLTDNTDVIGETSNAVYTYLAEVSVEEDELEMNNIFADNLDIENEADSFINSVETSPFGEI